MNFVFFSELRPHFSLASESDPADQDDFDDDVDPGRNSTQQSRPPAAVIHDDTVATSGVSTLSSTVSHESHNAQRSVSMELGRMKLETNRLEQTSLQQGSSHEHLICPASLCCKIKLQCFYFLGWLQVARGAVAQGEGVSGHPATSTGGKGAGDQAVEDAIWVSRSAFWLNLHT